MMTNAIASATTSSILQPLPEVKKAAVFGTIAASLFLATRFVKPTFENTITMQTATFTSALTGMVAGVYFVKSLWSLYHLKKIENTRHSALEGAQKLVESMVEIETKIVRQIVLDKKRVNTRRSTLDDIYFEDKICQKCTKEHKDEHANGQKHEYMFFTGEHDSHNMDAAYFKLSREKRFEYAENFFNIPQLTQFKIKIDPTILSQLNLHYQSMLSHIEIQKKIVATKANSDDASTFFQEIKFLKMAIDFKVFIANNKRLNLMPPELVYSLENNDPIFYKKGKKIHIYPVYMESEGISTLEMPSQLQDNPFYWENPLFSQLAFLAKSDENTANAFKLVDENGNPTPILLKAKREYNIFEKSLEVEETGHKNPILYVMLGAKKKMNQSQQLTREDFEYHFKAFIAMFIGVDKYFKYHLNGHKCQPHMDFKLLAECGMKLECLISIVMMASKVTGTQVIFDHIPATMEEMISKVYKNIDSIWDEYGDTSEKIEPILKTFFSHLEQNQNLLDLQFQEDV